jgi:ABC-type transporter Mla MlaB component
MTFEVSSAVKLTAEQARALSTDKTAMADLSGQLTEQIDSAVNALLLDIQYPESMMVKQFQDPRTTEVSFEIRLQVFTCSHK